MFVNYGYIWLFIFSIFLAFLVFFFLLSFWSGEDGNRKLQKVIKYFFFFLAKIQIMHIKVHVQPLSIFLFFDFFFVTNANVFIYY